jgi:hypothetical protein
MTERIFAQQFAAEDAARHRRIRLGSAPVVRCVRFQHGERDRHPNSAILISPEIGLRRDRFPAPEHQIASTGGLTSVVGVASI